MKNKKRAFKNEKGTTLVEIMLSVALLAIIVTPLLGAVVSSVKNNTAAKDKTEAIALAERVMGEIKARKSIVPIVSNNGDPNYPLSTYTIIPTDELKQYGNLVPCYEITEAVRGSIIQNIETTYDYAATAADDADFEIEIDQGTSTTDLSLSNLKFIKIDNIGGVTTETDIFSQQDFPINTKRLEFSIDKLGSSYSYYIGEKVEGKQGTKIDEGTFSPNDVTNGIIKLRVTYKGDNAPSSTEQLKIYTTVTFNVGDIFKVYVINNEKTNSGISFINKGDKTNFEVNYMDTEAFDYNYTNAPLNQLFKVIVTIKKNGNEIYKTSSYVKK